MDMFGNIDDSSLTDDFFTGDFRNLLFTQPEDDQPLPAVYSDVITVPEFREPHINDLNLLSEVDLSHTQTSPAAILAYMTDLEAPIPAFINADTSAMFEIHRVSPNHKNLYPEQFQQFVEHPMRTFRLYEEQLTNIVPSPRRGALISAAHALAILNGGLNLDDFLFIDARFPHEFAGGSITAINSQAHVINLPSYWRFGETFEALWQFVTPPPAGTRPQVKPLPVLPRYGNKIIIIFCEHSSIRAPGLYRNILAIDRHFSTSALPHYPEMYIVHGGFKALATAADIPYVREEDNLDAALTFWDRRSAYDQQELKRDLATTGYISHFSEFQPVATGKRYSRPGDDIMGSSKKPAASLREHIAAAPPSKELRIKLF